MQGRQTPGLTARAAMTAAAEGGSVADEDVSAFVAATMRQVEDLSLRVADRDETGMLREVLETLTQTLMELEVSSEELQAQNAELHAARLEIERERARYQDLFDLAPEPYVITDTTGIIHDSNRAAHTLLGRRPAHLHGKPIALFVHRDEAADFRRVLNWLKDGYSMHGWELRLAEGLDTQLVLAGVEPVPAADGGTELRWVLSDATSTLVARTRLSELLEETRHDASELRVMTEWQATLLGAAAHDLRTPLSAIDASLSAALSHPAVTAEEELRTSLASAATMVMKLRRLLPGLLDLSRLQATNVVAKRSEVHLPDMVAQVRSLLRADADRVDLALDVENLVADRLQLERILENLIANALHHTPRDEAVRVSSHERGVDVLLCVDDAGRGVPRELREAVFSPFTRITLDENGSPEQITKGLGLTLVAMFAAMHGGRAWVEKSELGGASFRVLLSAALTDTD